MKKRVISLVLATVMTAGLFIGCGSSDTSGTSEESASVNENNETADSGTSGESGGEGEFTVGYNYYGSGSYALLSLANNSKYAIEYMGDTAMGTDDNFSVESMVSDIENMINAGCDGVIVWLPVDSLYLTVADICEEYEVPFVLNDKIPSDSEILAELKENPYFIGAVSPANAIYGEAIAEYALSQGYKSCIVSTAGVGDPSDTPRLEAFQEAFEAGGGQILDILYADSSDGAQQQIEDSLVANPNPDFIYGTGSDYGIGAVGALSNAGNTETAVLTSGLDSQVLQYAADGKIEMVNGDFWVAGYFSAVIMEAYLHGNQLLDADGNVPYIDDIEPFDVPATAIDAYQKCFVDETCYSEEETQALANGTYDEFMDAVNSYSFKERVEKKLADGTITAEEAATAGVE